MIPETYYIKDIGEGGLAIMPRPRGNEWLSDEIKGLKHLGYDLVVSFLEKSEELELDLIEEKSLCEQNDIEFISFPITDRGVPDDNDFFRLVSLLFQPLSKEKKLYFIAEVVLEGLGLQHPVYLLSTVCQGKKHLKPYPKQEAFKYRTLKNKCFGCLEMNRNC